MEEFGKKAKVLKLKSERNSTEGLFPNIRGIYEKNICSGCGLCVSICPVGAIEYQKDLLTINNDVCFECGLCYTCCPRSFFPKELGILPNDLNGDIIFKEGIKNFKEIHTATTCISGIQKVAHDGGIV